MKLLEALKIIFPAQGATTMVSALLSGKTDSINDVTVIGKTIEEVQAELSRAEEDQRNCQSDWSYWGYEGKISYLRSAVYILKAADIVGPNNLADVSKPSRDGVVMDVQANIEDFGKRIYDEAIRIRRIAKEIAERELSRERTHANPH